MSYETKDASLSVIGVSAVILAFLVVASIAGSAWMYRGSGVAPSSIRQTSFRFGSEQRIDIREDYAQVIHTADERLHRYRWVDRNAGIAQIPIDRAMELVATGAKPAPGPKEPGQVP
jgi:hypothetical protein